MIIHLGCIHELARYPVKSMAGISTDSAFLGWHGLQGDGRFAFRRLNDNSGFPWLTASRLITQPSPDFYPRVCNESRLPAREQHRLSTDCGGLRAALGVNKSATKEKMKKR